MNKTIVSRVPRQPVHRLHLSSDAASLSSLKARQCSKIAEFREALIASALESLDAQAAVLGLSRSSTWAILNRNYKSSGLTSSVINRIRRSDRLPQLARDKLEEYVQEKLMGKYGHSPKGLRRFRDQLMSFPAVATGRGENQRAEGFN